MVLKLAVILTKHKLHQNQVVCSVASNHMREAQQDSRIGYAEQPTSIRKKVFRCSSEKTRNSLSFKNTRFLNDHRVPSCNILAAQTPVQDLEVPLHYSENKTKQGQTRSKLLLHVMSRSLKLCINFHHFLYYWEEDMKFIFL